MARLAMGRGVVRHGAAADERAVREGTRTNERPRCCVGRRDKYELVRIRFYVSTRDGAHPCGPCPNGVMDRRPWLIIIIIYMRRFMVHYGLSIFFRCFVTWFGLFSRVSMFYA